jgi:hypothetical protein
MRCTAFRAAAALAFLVAAGCGRGKSAARLPPAETLDGALSPSSLAAGLRRAGGGHFHATTLLRADVASAPPSAAGKPASPAAVTTTTDLWMDQAGNFRLVESNDQDGGREIVRVGGEIAVALRYGKTIRRPVQDTESNRVLAEALGGPWSAWEMVRRQVDVQPDGGVFRFKLGYRLASLPAGFLAAEGLRRWRDSVLVKSIEGQATLDAATQLPSALTCKAAFEAVREQVPIVGEVAVSAALDQLGKVPKLEMPDADLLRTRQRTILEERALLGGISAAAGRAQQVAP